MTIDQPSAPDPFVLRSLAAALRYVWWRRSPIAVLLVILWVPVEFALTFLPEQASTVPRLGVEGLVEPLWTAAIIHLRWRDARPTQAPGIGSPLPTALGMLRHAQNSYARLVGIRAVLEVRIWVGLLALGIPGVMLAVRYAFMDVLAICEDVGPTRCRERSATLVAGRAFGMLWLLLVGIVAPMGLSELLDWCLASSSSRVLQVVGHLFGALSSVVLPLALFEIYASARAHQQPRRPSTSSR
jgi:hypothetical protein